MGHSSKKKNKVLKYSLPLGVLALIAILLAVRSNHLSAEIATDQNPDPWPLSKEECGVNR